MSNPKPFGGVSTFFPVLSSFCKLMLLTSKNTSPPTCVSLPTSTASAGVVAAQQTRAAAGRIAWRILFIEVLQNSGSAGSHPHTDMTQEGPNDRMRSLEQLYYS